MEQVKKDHYSAFYKHFPVCDPSLGLDFLREIQVQYDMNSKPKMQIEKLQMFANSYVLVKQKLLWFKMWNECCFERNHKNFLSPAFLIPNFTSGCTRQLFGIKYSTSKCYFFICHFFLKILLLNCSCSCNLRLKCSSHLMQQSLIFFWL